MHKASDIVSIIRRVSTSIYLLRSDVSFAKEDREKYFTLDLTNLKT